MRFISPRGAAFPLAHNFIGGGACASQVTHDEQRAVVRATAAEIEHIQAVEPADPLASPLILQERLA